MPEFHAQTLVAVKKVLEEVYGTHDRADELFFSWGLTEEISGTTISRKFLQLAQISDGGTRQVRTEVGEMSLHRAMIESALSGPPIVRRRSEWTAMIASLRLDGFEVDEEEYATGETDFIGNAIFTKRLVLRRMLPANLPTVGIRDAQSELEMLLVRLGLNTAKGHFDQAIAAFSRGDWAASNAQIRSCFEAVIYETSGILGVPDQTQMAQYLKELGTLNPPLLYSAYNEWNQNDQKQQFLKGLWSRLHPEGSHPGLSEEDDCAFRLQIVSITLRLLLRRLDKRQSNP